MNEFQYHTPMEIEKESFAIIERELLGRALAPEEAPVIKRVIHTTADFSYADSLVFIHDAVAEGLSAIRRGAPVVTDTTMALSGINKKALEQFGGAAHCYIAEPEVAEAARRAQTTRAAAAVDFAAGVHTEAIFVFGNAPTALARLCTLRKEGRVKPALVIGAPVGFVNVVESKELLLSLDAPAIVARGRKGGSNVAAAVVNALLYMAAEEETAPWRRL